MPAVAISACLHGEPVRYDGTAKSLENTLDTLTKYLRLIPICPETGAGMGVPRPPIQLQRDHSGDIVAIGRDDKSLDMTTELREFAARSLARLGQDLCGYIVKSRSPSCGFNTTPVFNSNAREEGVTSGIQISHFHSQQPWLQLVDETTLAKPQGCEKFILRCLVMADIRSGCDQFALEAIHRHYADLLIPMPRAQRHTLEKSLAVGDTTRYWQAFGAGLQAAEFC